MTEILKIEIPVFSTILARNYLRLLENRNYLHVRQELRVRKTEARGHIFIAQADEGLGLFSELHEFHPKKFPFHQRVPLLVSFMCPLWVLPAQRTFSGKKSYHKKARHC